MKLLAILGSIVISSSVFAASEGKFENTKVSKPKLSAAKVKLNGKEFVSVEANGGLYNPHAPNKVSLSERKSKL